MVVIQDEVIIAKPLSMFVNPIGEALHEPRDEIMTDGQREAMVNRLTRSIFSCMDSAQNTHKANCYISGSNTNIDQNYMTRLSTNEFFFYTQEPLTLVEFEKLQNQIAEKAKKIYPGVQLILGSFAVKTADNKVMNVTPHITCGNQPEFHFLVKNYTSTIDVRYKVPDGSGGWDSLAVLDNRYSTQPTLPQITVDGAKKSFTFNNVIPCKTPGGTEFLTVVDICLDHGNGVGLSNYENQFKQDINCSRKPVNHVVISNSIDLKSDKSITSGVLHVDPQKSDFLCVKGIHQRLDDQTGIKFGINSSIKISVDKRRFTEYVINKYAYKVTEGEIGRSHQFEVNVTEKFKSIKTQYHQLKGDHLKTKILDDFKDKILNINTIDELKEFKKNLQDMSEYQILKTGQGLFTQITKIKTSSVSALEDMIKQREAFLEWKVESSKKP